ncbi:SusC/RagA family TonB-linked outer membrane protein [Mucilaginibacter sp. SP1R1]|uniref:SusC/RagA family TonB-linked outer membrane protein n=1 Tax=Mucilaginibacter sp. SP1R1 TaxID=2723091 RepID=UPI0017B627E7|nr:TonB-dependent receptor [Mucilaginibacter sp. SP1R1]MBB6149952.1 TonB-linked SusC/RagA family outer membrane protein [Mucilaginibacter sp. SP1R1]
MIKQRPPGAFSLMKESGVRYPIASTTNSRGFLQSSSACWSMAKVFMLSVILLFAAITVQAQKKTVTGKITDNVTNEPVSGASVKVKNTRAGVITDEQGIFKIDLADGSILEITSIGYKSAELRANFGQQMQIKLSSVNRTLTEVVVVGYGTAKRSDVTGSVSSLPKERLSQLPVGDVLQAMQGAIAGVNISSGSAVPGQSPSVLVRGVNTINGQTSPLIVIDGIPFENASLSDISTADVASVDVLKDVSATAIYGTRGANGVILVTTKRGKTGKAAISFNTYAGYENFAHTLQPMGPAEYVQKYADWKQQAGVTNDFVVPNLYEQQNYKAGITTDWLKEIQQQGFIQDHTLSVSGGNEDVKYYISGDYFSQKGVIQGFQNKRASIRSNIDAKITNYLSTGLNLNLVSNNSDGGRANLNQASQVSPYGRFKNPNGTYAIFPMEGEEAIQSPMLGLLNTRNDRRQNVIANVYAELRPFEGFKYRVNAGYTYTPTLFQNYQGRLAGDIAGGTAEVDNSERKRWIVENILSYEKNWDKSHLDFTGLYSAQENKYYSSTVNASGFINDALQFNNLQGANTVSASSEAITTQMVSQMLRVNYNYDSRYLLTATARRDGYSAFGSNTSKYGLFPSVALAWNISKESFMKNVSFVDNLKLRGSYGLSGNQSAVDPTSTISTFTTISIPSNGHPTTGVIADVLGNKNLKWESTYGSNIGVDFAVLNNRVTGTIETYNTHTKDLVLYRALPSATGYSQVVTNIGKVANKGLEVSLRTQNIVGDNFKWETNLNYSTNSNKIVDLYGDKKDDKGNRFFIGHPVNVIYDYELQGIWQVGENPANHDPGATPGDLKFADLDHSGNITSDGKDQTILGQSIPKWTGGITNTFHYKNFHLNVFIQTVQGVTKDNQAIDFVDMGGRQNLPAGIGYWTEANKSNTRPKLTYVNYLNYGYPQDASYTRIKDVTLSYTMPKGLLDKLKLGGLTIYVSGRNLATFTKWKGWDPEVSYANAGDTGNDYPLVRSFILGANITLR